MNALQSLSRAAFTLSLSSLAFTCGGSGSTQAPTTPEKNTKGMEEGAADTSAKAALSETQTFGANAETFGVECREGLLAAKKNLPLILAVSGLRSEENLLEPYNLMLTNIERTMALASLMDSVHPNEAVRKEAKSCEQEGSAFGTELSLNPALYSAFTAIETEAMDAATQKLVADTLRDYRRAGVDKDEATRGRLKAIDDELVKLGQVFGKNIVDDVKHIELSSAKELAGLPADYIASHSANKEGKIFIATNTPDMIPFMQYAESGELRKKLYIAGKSRAGNSNEKTLAAILKLREEKATILGYANWADYVTEDKMMKSGKKADAFIARVVKTAKKRASRDYKELLAWKKKNLDKRAKSVGDWEKRFIENKVKAANYSFDPQEVRPYFPYAQVQAGLLDITSKIYGIEYKALPDAKVWHQDVSAYEVLQGGKKIGRIYLDMHPRDGKYGHAAQFTLRSGVLGVQVPEGVLVCNFPNPRTSEGPALMEHKNVTTMFHEFGHLMHHILGGQRKWIEQSGVATEWDFVEAPSQMFEEWAWNYDTLKTFAKHYKTGAVLPKETVDRMRKADKFGLGIATVQQMFYAAISLKFHQIAPNRLKMLDTVKSLQSKYTPFAYVEGTNFHTSFGHLNGYSAIYYTYMWSLVIAKDLLTPFQKHGLMNTEWTYKYRDTILANGGTKDAADLVAEFLGRPFNFKAFEKFLRD